MRILSILARHGRDRYPEALAQLRAYHRARLFWSRCDVLVVDNGPGPVRAAPGEPETIAGPNDAWEFSAWDAAIAHLGPRLQRYDLVHLVTSAFRTLHTAYIDRCGARALRRVVGEPVALGHLDYYDQAVEVLGRRSQCWLRSSFLFLPPKELLRLGSLVSLRDGAPFFSGDPADPFLPAAPLSGPYRRYILDWLTGAGTGQGTAWHSRFDLTRETLPLFQAKTLAILNEQLLTVRLRAQGCAPVDATWLDTRVRRGKLGREPLAVPPWHEQLAQRDSSAITVARVEVGEPATARLGTSR